MEATLKLALAELGLTAIGVNIFNPQKPDITVYLHFQGGDCASATAATFEQAVVRAVAEAEDRRAP